MPRKGTKTDKTKMKEKGNISNPVKKIKKHAGSKERVAEILEKERESPSKKKHPYPAKCLPLDFPLFVYVYGGGAGFALCEAKKPVNNKPSYTPLCYSSTLRGMFEILTNYMIKQPMTIAEISAKLDHIYNMIEARVADKKPNEIFKEYSKLADFLEDFDND